MIVQNVKDLKLLKASSNFKCADIICDFCGYLAVKTTNVTNIDKFPSKVLQQLQKERMDAGIYFPLFVVLKNKNKYSVFYLSSDLQTEDML